MLAADTRQLRAPEDATCIAVANPGYGDRTALRCRRRPLDARVGHAAARTRVLNLADAHWLLARSGDPCRSDLHTDSPRQHTCRLPVLVSGCGRAVWRTRATMPSSLRSRKSAAAIHPRVFRHRVRVASSDHGHFEPRSGCSRDVATTRA